MKKLLTTIVILATLGALAYWLFPFISSLVPGFNSAASPAARESYVVPPAGEEYTSEQYRFSLTLPMGFSARELPSSTGGTTLVFEDDKANGIQVVITPFDEDLRVLTEARIHQDIPDLAIWEPQTVEVGESYIGLAFKSDNPAFDGASREVWFVYPECSRGVCQSYLWQISTYERLDELLKQMFSTWRFY